MPMRYSVALAWLAAAAACVAGTPRAPADSWGKNLVANPGFEADANGDGQPDGWNLPPGQWAWDAAEKHEGARSLRFANTDPKLYRLVTAPVALVPGVRYRIAAWVKGSKVRNGDPHGQGAGLCLEWTDKAGKWLGGYYPSCKSGTFGWTRLEGEAGPVPPEAAGGHLVLYLRKHNVGTAWFDDVEVVPIRGPALAIRLVEPAYRATAAAPTKGKQVTLEVRVNHREYELPKEGLRLEISLGDGVRFARPAPEGSEAARLSWSLPELAEGSHTLAVRLMGTGDAVLSEERTTLHVAKPAERKVTLDERGRLLVGGQPFFPLGLYLGPTEDEHLERIAAGGFNTILCYAYGPGKEPRAYLDRAKKHGLKVIFSVKDFYEGSRWYPKRAGVGDLDLIRNTVTDLRDHPALLAWYTNDELGPKWMPKLRAAYDLVCKLDPDHPAFQVLCVPGQNHLYYGVTDILGCDPYPVPRHGVTMVGDWVETARAGMSEAKPVWCVPQVFRWANYSGDIKDREPTLAEKRAMVFLALIHRAQGLVAYSYYDLLKGLDKGATAPAELFERRWKEVSGIAAEVRKLVPVLLEGKEVAADRTSLVRFRVLRFQKADHVLVVNTSPKAQLQVSVPVREGATARRTDADRATVVEGARLVDKLDPLEAAVYIVE